MPDWTGLRATVTQRALNSPLAPWVRAGEGFSAHGGASRAAALSYTTLLALVPLTALVVGLSKALVLRSLEPDLVSGYVQRLLDYAIPQLRLLPAAESEEALVQVVRGIEGAIDRIDAGALGLFGAAILIGIAVSLLSSVEKALNLIWGVERGRSLVQRIIYYWAGLALFVILMASLTLTSSTLVGSVLGWLPLEIGTRVFWALLPFLILGSAFSLLYVAIPHTHVPIRAAAIGGFTAGVLFQANNLLSALYLSRVITYSNVYGSIGAIPVMMVGLFVSWIIVLYGAEVAHAAATPSSQAGPFPEGLDVRARLALETARRCSVEYEAGRRGGDVIAIAEALAIPSDWVNRIVSDLSRAGILIPTAADEDDESLRWVPARPPSKISANDVLRAVGELGGDPLPRTPEVDAWLSRLREAESAALGHVSVAAATESSESTDP